MNPEEAVQAHRDLDGDCLCRSTGAPSGWRRIHGLSPERLIVAAAEAGVNVAIPKPGDRAVRPRTDAGSVDHWWRL